MDELIKSIEELFERVKNTVALIKLPEKKEKLLNLEKEMNKEGFWSDQKKAQNISEIHGSIKDEIEKWEKLQKDVQDLLDVAHMDEKDESINMLEDLKKQLTKTTKQFEKMELVALMSGVHDRKGAILSIHAGAGGVDAMDWSSMLMRMYVRFSESRDWKVLIAHETRGEEAGIKSVTLIIRGPYAYGYLKAEHGVHRLVRISPFDAEGMRHTSFALVETLPELEDVHEIEIDDKDLRVDTFLSSGKGGQNVQKNETAVRITHIPTGITASCQSERSQQQNKDNALKMLGAKLQQIKYDERKEEVEKLRGEYQQAAWGNQIRSYVLHPYHQVKDHRTGFEDQDPEKILDGDLMDFIEAWLMKGIE